MRSITFNNRNSLNDFGAYITTETSIGDVSPRTPSIKIPYRNGSLQAGRATGQIYYDDRELTYGFKLKASTRAMLNDRMMALKNWLMSDGTNTITDSSISGYHFEQCICTSITERLSEDNANGYTQIGYITAKFTAYPFLISDTDGSESL